MSSQDLPGNKPTVDKPTVGKRAVRGGMVFALASYLALVLGIGARKALAIILAPIDFGYVNAAISLVTIIFSFGAFSFSSAIINVRENLVEEPLEYLKENIFILTFGSGVLLTIASIVASLFLPEKPATPVITSLVGIYAVQRFLSAFDTFYAQILEREIDYSKISRVTLITNVVLHGLSVGCALAGFGKWSIPIGTFVSTVVSIGFHRYYVSKANLHDFHPSPWKYYRSKTAKWLSKFGVRVLFNRLFEAWLFQIDNLLVLQLMGTVILGYYSQAFTIAQMPAIALAPIVARVSIAAYAEIQHDRMRLTHAFSFTNFFLMRLLVAASVFVIVASEDLVRVFLSSKWQYSAIPLQALAGFVLTISLFENAKMLLGARLKLREISIVRAVQLAVLVGLLLTIGKYGMFHVGISVSFVSLLGYLFLLYYVKREVEIKWLSTFGYPLIVGIGAALLVLFGIEPFINSVIPPTNIWISLARLFLFGIISVIVVVVPEYLFRREYYNLHIGSLISRLSNK